MAHKKKRVQASKRYLLIREGGHWVLKRYGAARALILFKNRVNGDDFDQVFSATMTYAKEMEELCIMNDDGTVRVKLGRKFIELFEDPQVKSA